MTDDLCPYGEGEASGSGCIKPDGHDGPHIVTPGVRKEDDRWRAYAPGQEGPR